MAASRKLFLTHAGELAHRFVRDVGRDGLVTRFVRSYAERHGRQGLLSDPARLPELASTIGREALLVMAADVRDSQAQAFAHGPKGVLRPDDAAFIEAFYAEFLASLARGFDWSSGEASAEAEMFRRDLEMYRRWGQRPGPAAGAGRAGESPFRDRCALLLDPAMMEQARRGAVEFEGEILRTAARRFRQLAGRRWLFTAKAPRWARREMLRRKAKKQTNVARRSNVEEEEAGARQEAQVRRPPQASAKLSSSIGLSPSLFRASQVGRHKHPSRRFFPPLRSSGMGR